MLLLVLDTSGKHGIVALVRSGPEPRKIGVIESVPLAGGTFSAQLVPQIAALLAKHGFSKTDLEAFVIVSGPGSFTGLRVGLAAIKALAEILGKPIVPVSLLEVIAFASRTRGRVMAALDAGRGEVYAGEYDVADSALVVREQLIPTSEFISTARNLSVTTSDEGLAKSLHSAGIAAIQAFAGAEEIARVGLQKLAAGSSVKPEQLEANYIRRSDSEILAKPVPSS